MGDIYHGDRFPYTILFTLIRDDAGWATHTPYRQSRIILAVYPGTTIFAEQGNHCHFHYLVNLVDLDRVRY